MDSSYLRYMKKWGLMPGAVELSVRKADSVLEQVVDL